MWQVVLLRLGLSTLILKFPLAGGVIAICLDYFDLQLLYLFDQRELGRYQSLDKTLDLYYLALEAYVVSNWRNLLVKYTALLLFLGRLVGSVLFVITQEGVILMIFPNVFEPFFLIYLIQLQVFRRDLLTSFKQIALLILFLLIPKLIHEYLLHVNTTYPWSENKYVKLILGN